MPANTTGVGLVNSSQTMIPEDAIRTALLGVIDPELGDNVVDLGMVRGITVGDDDAVSVTIALTVAGCPLQKQLRTDIEGRVGAVPGVTEVRVRMAEMDADEKAALMARARWKARDRGIATDIPATAHILAIASTLRCHSRERPRFLPWS